MERGDEQGGELVVEDLAGQGELLQRHLLGVVVLSQRAIDRRVARDPRRASDRRAARTHRQPAR